jgi:hypothetical protein
VAQAAVLPGGFELPLEPRLPRVGSVDAVALKKRAASLAKRSIKKDAEVFARVGRAVDDRAEFSLVPLRTGLSFRSPA